VEMNEVNNDEHTDKKCKHWGFSFGGVHVEIVLCYEIVLRIVNAC
jgi:hypothetical protein